MRHDDLFTALLIQPQQTAAELQYSIAELRLERMRAAASVKATECGKPAVIIPSLDEIKRALKAYEARCWVTRKRDGHTGCITPLAPKYAVTRMYFASMSDADAATALLLSG
ncbi:MAG TPA: hypothetical protein VHD55_00890 [Candidatus Paceibacterota bacterium]|nr:hypothetical protein [Candidatus Paceibacterota bacterium]